ncbi:metallopeptidase family protein [Deferrisoma camini]|uniref:metallopeptidase family protein n=1 Tax=Deferrisoma camini TaxID=1035120 RepID=UPI00046D7239|nr:metallopeptidase family protein [Deferrisoma camini]
MDRRRFEQIAEDQLAALPRALLDRIDNVTIWVEDWPDPQTLAEMGIRERDGLLGLYQGWPLSERTHDIVARLPDRIVLFQGPIERYAAAWGVPVEEVVRDTLVHEIGHYLGLSEAQLRRLERGG